MPYSSCQLSLTLKLLDAEGRIKLKLGVDYNTNALEGEEGYSPCTSNPFTNYTIINYIYGNTVYELKSFEDGKSAPEDRLNIYPTQYVANSSQVFRFRASKASIIISNLLKYMYTINEYDSNGNQTKENYYTIYDSAKRIYRDVYYDYGGDGELSKFKIGGFQARDEDGRFLYDDDGNPVQAGFTQELAQQQNEIFGHTEESKSTRFKVALRFRLTDEGFTVTALNDSIQELSDSRIYQLEVLPYTDTAGRIYVISDGIYEGIVLLNNKGEFMRFVGVNYTTMSFWDALWRNIATEEQRKQMTSILQTEFKNFAMDSQGFIYTVSRPSTNSATGATDDKSMIKRINQAGKDVLVRNGYSVPKGDLVTILVGNNRGGSQFTGITVNDYGMYTVVDAKAGRLFTYDKEGNLLYISAGRGAEVTDLVNPVAVSYQGDNLLVLEKNNRAVIRFIPTEVGALINKAVKLHAIGRSEEASEEWQNVINQNPNYELAYVGVGKTYLEAERYVDAMSYFKTGFSVSYYSKAYKNYRDDIIKTYFPWVMTVIVVAVLAKIGHNIYKNIRYKKAVKDAGDIDG